MTILSLTVGWLAFSAFIGATIGGMVGFMACSILTMSRDHHEDLFKEETEDAGVVSESRRGDCHR